MIRLDSLGVRLVDRRRGDRRWVLRDITIAVPRGCIYGLIGPGAAGKSVLLKTLAGLLPVEEGLVEIDGVNVGEAAALELEVLRRRMGMAFQNNALFDHLTVSENIAFPLRRLFAPTDDEVREKVAERLASVTLPGYEERLPPGLSGGQKSAWRSPERPSRNRHFCFSTSLRRALIRSLRNASSTSSNGRSRHWVQPASSCRATSTDCFRSATALGFSSTDPCCSMVPSKMQSDRLTSAFTSSCTDSPMALSNASFVHRIGAGVVDLASTVGQMMTLLRRILQRSTPARFDRRELLRHLEFMAIESLPIVVVTALFSGAIVVIQAAPVVQRFGAEGLLGWGAGFGVLREIGPSSPRS